MAFYVISWSVNCEDDMKSEVHLVEINSDQCFCVDLMYAKNENMMRTPVYQKVGLGNRCFVHQDLAQCLSNLRPLLLKKHLKLKICDAYRPPEAFWLMKKIIPMEGFFALSPERSQHCHASAVDVTLLDESGKELVFPCAVDAYDEKFALQIARGQWDDFKAHLQKAKYDWNDFGFEKEIEHRTLLRNLMESVGFVALEHEWWHFNLPNKEKYPLVDCAIDKNGEIRFFIE